MAAISDGPASGAMHDESTASPDTIPGPAVLFWIVCFALNAMAEPSGSFCGLGYEPYWLLRISPIMSLFDGTHMIGTWLISYLKLGKSYRTATAETLLGRLVGGNMLFEVLDMGKARHAIDEMALAAAKVNNIIPSKDEATPTLKSGDVEKARDAVKHLISRTFAVSVPFNRFTTGSRIRELHTALAALQLLSAEATETEILLGQLIVSGDSAGEKEQIRRAMLPYRSHVIAAKESLETLTATRDVSKARTTLKHLTSQMGFRWFCFGLGVLPQVIKLFGSSGIPLIQLCGAMYLFSWVSFETLVIAGKLLELDKSDAAWGIEWDIDMNMLKRDDEATQSRNEMTGRLPRGTVAMSSIAVVSSEQMDGGSETRSTAGSDRHFPRLQRLFSLFLKAIGGFIRITTSILLLRDTRALVRNLESAFGITRTTEQDPTSYANFVRLRMFSIFLGLVGFVGHISTSVALMEDIRALGPVPKGVVGKNLPSLILLPVWINNLSPRILHPMTMETTFIIAILSMTLLAICQLSLRVAVVLAAGQTEKLTPIKYLLIFVGASITSRLFIGLFCVGESIRLKMLTALRVLFCCVPPVTRALIEGLGIASFLQI